MKLKLLSLAVLSLSLLSIGQAMAKPESISTSITMPCKCTPSGNQITPCLERIACQNNCDCQMGRYCKFPAGPVKSGTPGICMDR